MIVTPSRHTRRSRVNCDTLLKIDSGQSVTADNPNLNVSLPDYTVSVVVYGSGTISKGTWSISVAEAAGRPSDKNHIVFTAAEMFLNTQPVGTHSKTWDSTGGLTLGAGLTLQHLKIANRTWTMEEIRQDQREPGNAPTGTHTSILAHYVADREGLVMWDVVEQYNYAKPSVNDTTWGKWARKSGKISGDFTLTLNWIRVGSSSSADDFGFILDSEALSGEILNFTSEYDLALNSRAHSVATINSQHFGNANIATAGANPAIGQIGYSLKIERVGNAVNLYENAVLIASRTATSEDYYFYNTPRGTSDNVAEFVLNGQKITEYDQLNGTAVNEAGDVYKTNALQAHHATLQNFTPAQVDTAAGTQDAYLDFYEKSVLKPYVDSDQDGTPDQPLVEKASLLPPLRNALRFDAGQTGSAGNVGSIRGIRFAVQLAAGGDQALFDLTASDLIEIASGSVAAPELQTIYVDGQEQNAIQAAAILTDLVLHDIVILFSPIAATDFSIQLTGHLAALELLTDTPALTDIIAIGNNTLLRQPGLPYQSIRSGLYDLNQINSDFTLSDLIGANTIALSGFTAANLDPGDPAYSLTPINDLR